MPAADLYQLHGILFPSGGFLSQVQQGSLVSGSDLREYFPSGSPLPMYSAIMRQQPEITGQTTQIKTALSGFGGQGVALIGGNTDLFFRKAVNEGTRVADATASHYRLRTNRGLGLITDISCRSGSEAQASFRIIPTYDQTNDIVQLLADGAYVALSGSSLSSEVFTMGPLRLTGTFGSPYTFTQLQDWRLSFNYELIYPDVDGEQWPTFVGIRTLSSRLTINTLKLTEWSKLGLRGAVITAATIYLRRRDRTREYLNGDAQHCSLTATFGQVVPQEAGGGGTDDASTRLEVLFTAATPSSVLWTPAVDVTIV